MQPAADQKKVDHLEAEGTAQKRTNRSTTFRRLSRGPAKVLRGPSARETTLRKLSCKSLEESQSLSAICSRPEEGGPP